MASGYSRSSSSWTAKENKKFEEALARFDKETPDRWQNISKAVGTKSPEECRRNYDILVRDLMLIDSGGVPLPDTWGMRGNNRGIAQEQRMMKNLKI